MTGLPSSFVGVDGCKGGWVAISVDGDGRLAGDVFSNIPAVVETYSRSLVLVDVPVGLLESGAAERACDMLARRLLGRRASSVFPAPARAALSAVDYRSACDINQSLTGRRLSKQSWAIASKIHEVNAFLATRKASLPVVREMHPELCLWGLNGCAPLVHPKDSEEGYQERLRILSHRVPNVEQFVEQLLSEHRRRVLARDDVVDALVGAVTALLGRDRLLTLPEQPERDSANLPMEMVYVIAPERGTPTVSSPPRAVSAVATAESPRSRPRRKSYLGTTEVGRVNRNRQQVVRATDQPGNDHAQYVYVLRCLSCHHEYGANGSDVFQRKCPDCQGGAKGLPLP